MRRGGGVAVARTDAHMNDFVTTSMSFYVGFGRPTTSASLKARQQCSKYSTLPLSTLHARVFLLMQSKLPLHLPKPVLIGFPLLQVCLSNDRTRTTGLQVWPWCNSVCPMLKFRNPNSVLADTLRIIHTNLLENIGELGVGKLGRSGGLALGQRNLTIPV